MAASNLFLPGAFVPHAGDAPAAAVPADGRVLAIVARQLPRLRELAACLQAQVLAWDSSALEAALHTHLEAAAALRFELLVSPGLRAGLLGRDEAAFRAQVAAVSECTEASWAAIRRYLDRCASAGSELEATSSDFTMEFRSLVRGVESEARTADLLQAHLSARAAAAGAGVAQQALGDLLARNAVACGLLAGLQKLCAAAAPSQRAAYQLSEAQVALRGTLKGLSARLRGGLLERLRVLVSGAAFSGDELQAAQQSRAELRDALSEAIAEAAQLRTRGEDLLVWLMAVQRDAAISPGSDERWTEQVRQFALRCP